MWYPLVPERIENPGIFEIGEVNDNLKQACPITADKGQSGINLVENLPDLAGHILRGIVCHFDEIGRLIEGHGIRPPSRDSVPLNVRHSSETLFSMTP